MKAGCNTLDCDVWCYAGDNISARVHSLQMNDDTHVSDQSNEF